MAGGNIYVGGGASGDKANYSVVASMTKPSSPKENTIWVDTTVDKEVLSRVTTSKLSCYINADTGKITTPSSNTCYTKYFSCTPGHQYRFQLNDGQTTVISSFTKTPASGVTGTNIYGIGKTQGAASLDYTVTAPDGATHLGIYYYDSSANSGKGVYLTVTDLTIKASLPNSVAMTGNVFSSTEPTTPNEGCVWFKTDEYNHISFDALQKNVAMIYPRACYQYYSNAWQRKEMQIYQNGAWNDLRFYLFKDGVDNTEITGGYVGTGSYGKFKIENGVIFTYASGGTTGACRTVNPISLDGYITLNYNVTEFNANSMWLGVTAGTSTGDAEFVAFKLSSTITSGIITVDISEISSLISGQAYYIVMRVTGASTSKGVKVSDIWLE